MSMPVPQVEKRERDASTEAIIQEALEAEERLKKARKGNTAGRFLDKLTAQEWASARCHLTLCRTCYNQAQASD